MAHVKKAISSAHFRGRRQYVFYFDRIRRCPSEQQAETFGILGKAFAGFQEGQPDFAPTFKVERMAGVSHQSELGLHYSNMSKQH